MKPDPGIGLCERDVQQRPDPFRSEPRSHSVRGDLPAGICALKDTAHDFVQSEEPDDLAAGLHPDEAQMTSGPTPEPGPLELPLEPPPRGQGRIHLGRPRRPSVGALAKHPHERIFVLHRERPKIHPVRAPMDRGKRVQLVQRSAMIRSISSTERGALADRFSNPSSVTRITSSIMIARSRSGTYTFGSTVKTMPGSNGVE
jgi:hypothetical protein